MVKASKLHEVFRRNINRINSNYLQSVSVVDVDGFLTEAYFAIYENLITKGESNAFSDDRIKQKLRVNIPLEPVNYDIYSKVVYPSDAYKIIRRFVNGCREGCTSRIINVHMTQSSDLNESLQDPFWKPSFEWRETIGRQDHDGLIVYHNCDFDIKDVVIDYYTKPSPIRCPSLVKDDCYRLFTGRYIDNEGNEVTTDSDFEIDHDALWIKVAHLAAAKALKGTGDIADYKAMVESIMLDDKIYL